MKWISITERLPEVFKSVVVWGIPGKCTYCNEDGETYGYELAYLNCDGEFVYGEASCKIKVTHWFKPEDPFKEEK